MRLHKVVLGAMAMLVATALPATAQYPGTTSTTTPPGSQTAGTLAVGAETTILSCGFRPGSTTVSVNGAPAGADTADADGCVRTTLTVLSTTQVQVNPIVPATCNNNVLSVAGTDPSGAARTVTTSFGIDCPATAGGGTLPRTGSMILRWSLAGGALLAVGALMVLAGRRPIAATD